MEILLYVFRSLLKSGKHHSMIPWEIHRKLQQLRGKRSHFIVAERKENYNTLYLTLKRRMGRGLFTLLLWAQWLFRRLSSGL